MSQDASISQDLIGQLIDGRIDDDNAQRLLRLERKDKDRFFKYLDALQQRVPWPERILLRLGDKLYVVHDADGARVVKCHCGHVFGDYRENWKLRCRIRVKRGLEEMCTVYDPAPACPEPGIQEIREFFCPGCATQHAVEVVPPGYPLVFELLPDLDRFYRETLGRPLPDEAADWYEDRSATLTEQWVNAG